MAGYFYKDVYKDELCDEVPAAAAICAAIRIASSMLP